MPPAVIVTGASQGVGLGIASVFLKHGARVVGADRNPAPAALLENPAYTHLQGDLTDAKVVAEVVAGCLSLHGRLDSMINNAGVGNAKGFLETTDADFQRYYDINVGATVAFCRESLPHLKKTRGSIVNIASVFGLVGAAQSAAYVPTKFAVVGITKMLATEFGRDGVRVNAVAPGLITSPGTRQRIETNAWWHRMMIEGSPLGRVGEPEEIGEACWFLASPVAGFITGVVLPVDGGWSIAKFLPAPEGAG